MTVRGRGRVQLPAYGIADAEHQVEKELRALWPEVRITLGEIARSAHAGAIVEEFSVAYQLDGAVDATAQKEAEARREALRVLRERFAGTRFSRVRWETP